MKIVKVAQLRNELSRFLDYVRAGGHVVILDRDRPVAEIVPISADMATKTHSEHLHALERDGLVRRGTGALPKSFLSGALPGKRARVLDALLEERHGN